MAAKRKASTQDDNTNENGNSHAARASSASSEQPVVSARVAASSVRQSDCSVRANVVVVVLVADTVAGTVTITFAASASASAFASASVVATCDLRSSGSSEQSRMADPAGGEDARLRRLHSAGMRDPMMKVARSCVCEPDL